MEKKFEQKQYYKILLLIIMLTVTSVSTLGVLQSVERVGSSGIIVKPLPPPIINPPSIPDQPPPEPEIQIDVYQDLLCTKPLTSIAWGRIAPGGAAYFTFYIKNNGAVPLFLGLDTENWDPISLTKYASLTWNYGAYEINPKEVSEVTLQLNISNDCPEYKSFSFDIVIIGS